MNNNDGLVNVITSENCANVNTNKRWYNEILDCEVNRNLK